MKKVNLILISGGIALLTLIIGLVASSFFMGINRNVLKMKDAGYGGTYEMASVAESFSGSGGSYEAKSSSRRLEAAPPETNILRKLIRRAELNLEVKSCDETFDKILELVNSLSGIIIDSQIQKDPNEAKRAYTVLKVDPKDFGSAIMALKALGKVEMERITAEDITEEYIDLDARLKNTEVVRDRLLSILQDKAKQVKDILEVERELGRVNETIEQLKGRIKYLDRQVDLSTITVNYYEPKAITPEQPSLMNKFKQTIKAAIEAFVNVFNGTIVVIAAVLPVLLWLFIIFIIIVVFRKIFIRKNK